MLTSWWGAKNGGRTIRSSPGTRAPASEWSAVSSSDSSAVRSGSRLGRRSARVVLPAPLGPIEHQVVAAGGGHLEGVLGVGHALDVDEVELVEPRLAAPAEQAARERPATGGASGTGSSLSCAETWASERIPNTHDAGHHRRLAHLRLGHEHLTDPVARGGQHHRQHARHRAQSARQGQLAHEQRLAQQVGLDLAVGRQHGHGDGQVEVGAALGQVGRREQDRDPLGARPLQPAVDHGHPAPLARLVDGDVGAADHRRADHAARDVGLDLDQVALRPLQPGGVGRGDRHQPIPRTCSTTDGPLSGRVTATRSTRRSRGSAAWTASHSSATRRSRCDLGVVDRLVRQPAGVARAGLDLARDQHVAVAQQQVDLAGGGARSCARAAPCPCRSGDARPGSRRSCPRPCLRLVGRCRRPSGCLLGSSLDGGRTAAAGRRRTCGTGLPEAAVVDGRRARLSALRSVGQVDHADDAAPDTEEVDQRVLGLIWQCVVVEEDDIECSIFLLWNPTRSRRSPCQSSGWSSGLAPRR